MFFLILAHWYKLIQEKFQPLPACKLQKSYSSLASQRNVTSPPFSHEQQQGGGTQKQPAEAGLIGAGGNAPQPAGRLFTYQETFLTDK